MASFEQMPQLPEQPLAPGDKVFVKEKWDEIWTLDQIKDEDGLVAYLHREDTDSRGGSVSVFFKTGVHNIQRYIEPAPRPRKRKAA